MSSSKYVCITGASSGIGEACAKVFAQKGYNVALGARRIERLENLKRELVSLGAASVFFDYLDVCSDESITIFVQKMMDYFKQNLDILVNNAGLALGFEHIKDGNFEDWKTMFDTNVLGVLNITKKILPYMLTRNIGHVVFIGSIAGHQVYEHGAVYCASKHALKAIAKTLRLELNGTNIKVSTIDPGMVETEFSIVRLRNPHKAKKVYEGMNPLVAQDVAECVDFVVTRPAHVNIDEILVMPLDQASVYRLHRRKDTNK